MKHNNMKMDNFVGTTIKGRWFKNVLLVMTIVLFIFSCIIVYFSCTKYFKSAELAIRARNSRSIDTFFSAYNTSEKDTFTMGAYEFVENFQYKDIMEVWVLDKDGKFLVSSSGFSVSTSSDWEDYQLALEAEDNIGVKRLRLSSGEPVTAMTYILRDSSGKNYGALRYLVSMEDMYNQLKMIFVIIIAAFVLVVALMTPFKKGCLRIGTILYQNLSRLDILDGLFSYLQVIAEISAFTSHWRIAVMLALGFGE